MAKYSTIEPALRVGTVTVSSPVSLSVAELVKVPLTVRLAPFRSKVPPELFKSPGTVKLFELSDPNARYVAGSFWLLYSVAIQSVERAFLEKWASSTAPSKAIRLSS